MYDVIRIYIYFHLQLQVYMYIYTGLKKKKLHTYLRHSNPYYNRYGKN